MSRQFFRTRKAKVDDYSACLPLFSLLYHGDIGANFKHTFGSFIRNDDGVVLLAEDSYKVVGILVGSYHLDIDWEGRIARIDALIVDDACRKTGIGRKLVDQIIAMAKSKNCRAVKSRINRENVIAQKFHESLGFIKANTYEYFLDFQEQRKQ
jgi:ribosomal protein S18 acetylase RimI-like enzyme